MMYFSNRGGFTLVETLVAISILLLVVIGPITVAQRGIKSAYYANEQVTAVFLAQEAVEAIRELRDTNALGIYSGDAGETWDWYSSLEGDCTVANIDNTNGGCAFNPENGNFVQCDAAGFDDCRLYLEPGTSAYVHTVSGNQDSGYTRRVRIGDALVDGGIPIQVEVSWQSTTFGGSSPGQSVVLETWLYDHYERYETF